MTGCLGVNINDGTLGIRGETPGICEGITYCYHLLIDIQAERGGLYVQRRGGVYGGL
jgi:hypothetical protein